RYVPEGVGYLNKVQFEYYSNPNYTYGLSLNYLFQGYKNGPESFINCNSGLFENSRATQEFIYLSIPLSYHFSQGNFKDFITFSIGPSLGFHNFPKEFIQSRKGFLFTSSCTEAVYTREFFTAIDMQLDFNFRFGARSGIFLGGNFLFISKETPKRALRIGYLVDIF
ncbi:MAG: hypothetical protein KDC52_06575, partial [Ignavibacteriae bacterium]|nr:hypothetical protein [Ignavibacteriota bacterium]